MLPEWLGTFVWSGSPAFVNFFQFSMKTPKDSDDRENLSHSGNTDPTPSIPSFHHLCILFFTPPLSLSLRTERCDLWPLEDRDLEEIWGVLHDYCLSPWVRKHVHTYQEMCLQYASLFTNRGVMYTLSAFLYVLEIFKHYTLTEV